MIKQTRFAPFSLLSFFLMLSSVLFSTLAFAQVETGWMVNPDHPPAKTRFVVTGQVNPTDKTVEGFLEVASRR